MKGLFYNLFLIVSLSCMFQGHITAQTADGEPRADFKFKIEKAYINKSLWSQPYRFENKELKTLSVQLIVQRASTKITPLDFNDFTLRADEKRIRIRPTALFYYKRDKKIYLKSKTVNKNYDAFNDTPIDGFDNFEAKTFKVNFLGIKKKKIKSSVKLLKQINIKGKAATYYIDFPVSEDFSYGKIYYKNEPIGFAALAK